jgi:hypothetical protein
MDLELDNGNVARNHLGQRFRATTEPPADNRSGPLARNKFNRSKQYSEHGSHYTSQQAPQSRQADLESSTQTLKSLLSINSTPSHQPSSTPPFQKGDAPASPSPVHHTRSHSAAQPPHRRLPTATSASTTPRRIVSTSGIPPPNHLLAHPQYNQPITSTSPISEEDQNVKAEKQLRKLLNLS